MIQANELRIGNFANYENRMHFVTSINNEYITIHRTDEIGFINTSFDSLTAIPLRSEILEKAGFKKTLVYPNGQETEAYEHIDITFCYTLNSFFLFIEIENDPFYSRKIGKPIKYVHHLQNLYFDLALKELEIHM